MKYLVYSLGGIGDALLTVPLIKALRKYKKDDQIDVLVQYPQSRDIIQDLGVADNVYLLDRFGRGRLKAAFWFLLFTLKNFRRYDFSISTYPSNRWQYNVISFVINAKKRLAHKYQIKRTLSSLYFLNNYLIDQEYPLHNIDENFKLLDAAGIKTQEKDKDLSITLRKENQDFADKFIKNIKPGKKKIIAIHAGSGETKNLQKKRWDKDKFAKLINLIDKKHDAIILMLGGKNEQKLKDYIIKNSKVDVVDVDASIMNTAAIINKSDLLICNDALLLHLSHALKTKNVSIFGPTDPRLVLPRNVKYEVVTNNFYCSPCYYYSNMELGCPEKIGYACMKSITVEQVFDAVNRVLG